MRRTEFADVFKSLAKNKIGRVGAGAEDAGRRRSLEPLLEQVELQVALDLITDIVAGYDPSKDPYKRFVPNLSTFERRLRGLLRSGAQEGWLAEMRHGDVIESQTDRDRYGIVEKAENETRIWAVSHSRIARDAYWSIEPPSRHMSSPWKLARPDVGASQVSAWWANWLSGVYDGAIPYGPIKAAGIKYGIDIDAGSMSERFRGWPFMMLDGKTRPKVKPETKESEPKQLDMGADITEALSGTKYVQDI